MESKLSVYLREALATIEDGTPNEAKIAQNLVDIATGKKGSSREQLTAINLVYERIEGKAKGDSLMEFLKGMKKVATDKYKKPIEIEGEAEVVEDLTDESIQ